MVSQTLEFEAILDERVQAQTAHFTADYARLSVEKAELHRLVMEMKSHMDGICAPPY
jgi:hypothetical protein